MPGFRGRPSPFDPNLRKHVADQAFQLEGARIGGRDRPYP